MQRTSEFSTDAINHNNILVPFEDLPKEFYQDEICGWWHRTPIHRSKKCESFGCERLTTMSFEDLGDKNHTFISFSDFLAPPQEGVLAGLLGSHEFCLTHSTTLLPTKKKEVIKGRARISKQGQVQLKSEFGMESVVKWSVISQNSRNYSSGQACSRCVWYFEYPSSLLTRSGIMESLPIMKSTSHVIKLNVGGSQFSTTSATLLKAPEGSPLNVIGKGLATESPIFIDRDPLHFRIILNFLRDGSKLAIPIEERQRNELLVEAKYYGLHSLCELLSQASSPTLPARENSLWEIAKMESTGSYKTNNPQEVKASSAKDLSILSKAQPQALCYMCKSSIPAEVSFNQ